MNARQLSSTLFIAPLLLLAACSDAPSSTPPPGSTMSAGTQAAAPKSESTQQLPPSHPPIDTTGGGMSGASMSGSTSSGGVTFTAPAGWVSETPSSTMRKAQFKLPRQGTDKDDATVAVFFFGKGQGGPIEDNLVRWANEYEQPDGRKSTDVMKRSTRKVNGMDVTEMDITGTYSAAMPSGPGGGAKNENWRTLAA